MSLDQKEIKNDAIKIVLSRKGFDSANGDCPSPIFDLKTLLSLPIPSSEDALTYNDLRYGEISYSELLHQLGSSVFEEHCHLDPDLNKRNPYVNVEDWKPAFGQVGPAQGYLSNKVNIGDIFLFFGSFRGVKKEGENYRYYKKSDFDHCEKGEISDFYKYSELHVVYGYMQVGRILKRKEEIEEYKWHPHASEFYLNKKNNTLYIPTEKLSFLPNLSDLPGFGTLDFRLDRVLTAKDHSKAIWTMRDWLKPHNVCGNRQNSAKNQNFLYYAGIWQELVLKESKKALDWAISLISPESKNKR